VGTRSRLGAKAKSPERTRRAGAAAALLALTLLAYLPALGAGFVWDDDDYVTDNPTLRSLDGLRRIWLEPGAVPQYYPVTFTSLWIEYRLWGLDPFGYHLTNVALHALNALLLWTILARLQIAGAGLAAAVFALHPVHVESVAWITERKNVLSGAFYLASALAYLRAALPYPAAGRPAGARENARFASAAALVLFVAALLSKTVTCSLPAALLLVLWWKKGRVGSIDAARLAPFFVLGAGLAAVTIWIEKQHVGASGADWDLSFVERTLVAGRALWFYAGKVFLPVRLTFIYPRWEIDAAQAWQFVPPAAAVAVLLALFFARRRLGRGALAAVLFFAGTLVPALGFADVFPMRYSFVADHFQYLASIGLIVAACAAGAGVWRPRGATGVGIAFSAALLLLLGGATARQANRYRDAETLWRDTLAKNPGAWMAHNNLGLLLLERGDAEQALAHFEAATAVKADDDFAFNNIGNVFAARGDMERAAEHFAKALAINPRNAEALSNLGGALATTGRLDEAALRFEAALAVRPLYADAHNNLANVHALQGRSAEAEAHYRQALRIDPDYADAHRNLAVLLAARGSRDEAAVHYRAALQLRPGWEEARRELVGLGAAE
jgi:tetratricopeptide (TPR) repeat protein